MRKGIIKYILRKTIHDGYGGNYAKTQIVYSKCKVKELQKKDWYIIKKNIPIFTYLSDCWSKFNTNQKISVIGIIIASIVAIVVDNTGCD